MTTIHRGQELNGLSELGSGSAGRTQGTQGQPAQVPSPAQPAASTNADEVQITSAAQMLAKLEQQISGTPDINQGRVDAIRQALDKGTYTFDSSKVADGLLAAQKLDAQASAGPSAGSQSNSAKAFADTAKG